MTRRPALKSLIRRSQSAGELLGAASPECSIMIPIRVRDWLPRSISNETGRPRRRRRQINAAISTRAILNRRTIVTTTTKMGERQTGSLEVVEAAFTRPLSCGTEHHRCSFELESKTVNRSVSVHLFATIGSATTLFAMSSSLSRWCTSSAIQSTRKF